MSRSRASAKQAGSKFETDLVNGLAWDLKNDGIERRVTNGSKDRGDVTGVRTAWGERVTIEAKDYGGRLLPSEWLREVAVESENDGTRIGVVVAKRRGVVDHASQYVIMDVRTLVLLIQGGTDASFQAAR